MRGGAAYGLFMGVIIVASRSVWPPHGAQLLTCALVLQLASAAMITWKRTRLGWMSGGMAFGSIAMLVVLLSEVGAVRQFAGRNATTEIVLSFLALGFFAFLLEKRLNPVKWLQWNDQARQATLIDVLLFRHISMLADRKAERSTDGA